MIRRIVLTGLLGIGMGAAAQTGDAYSYVDPMIGTAKSGVYTRWGNEGGVYPGAVAPWGYMQLSPETREGKGYDYADNKICYFSCAHHPSGYPNGSAGDVRVMAGVGARTFSHGDEHANPGYYRVSFDNGVRVEATASVRMGLFRFTFPEGVEPVVVVEEGSKAAMRFSEPYTGTGGELHFRPALRGETIIVMAISVSPIDDKDNAERRLAAEPGAMGRPDQLLFERVRKATEGEWRQQLSVVEIGEGAAASKKKFYTALYHSMLLPWIESDAGQKDRYGSFSPWDTFRSLHPLLCLLFPDRQRDMVQSLLDIYKTKGHLPTGPMTGNHAVPVIVDSWLKGIRTGDSAFVYAAMRKGVADAPYLEEDRGVYTRLGYIPLSYPESVTRTVEYAYDDWSLGEYASKVMHREGDAILLDGRRHSYRNLFDAETFFELPRDEEKGFRRRLGTSGYKEGDPWVYSYFAPQDPADLVNLMGGREAFAGRLDSALKRGDIVFDNETVFQVPYLFNYAGRPDRTQEWISAIRDGRFSEGPGGLPGNDDMGSMSSWYVFSAMGFYPVCPGRPRYDLGAPLFGSMTLHLAGGKRFVIRASGVSGGTGAGGAGVSGTNKYVQQVRVNGALYKDLFLSHERIVRGGEIEFVMGAKAVLPPESGAVAGFEISGLTASKNRVVPNEHFWVRFRVKNNGVYATKIVRLMADGVQVGERHCLLGRGESIEDSVGCRLYAGGTVILAIEGGAEVAKVEVLHPKAPPEVEVRDLTVLPMLKRGDVQYVSYTIKNIGGDSNSFYIPFELNGSVLSTISVRLGPGAERRITQQLPAQEDGVQTVQIREAVARYKVYKDPRASLLLDLPLDSLYAGDSQVRDRSGFGNEGKVEAAAVGSAGMPVMGKQGGVPVMGLDARDTAVMGLDARDTAWMRGRLRFGKSRYVEVGNAPSLDVMGETITMMAWVFPAAPGGALTDIFTKGDNHVLQVSDNSSLSFFAGGWGRGDCTVKLPGGWFGRWHHIAGVCYGNELRLYVDGILSGKAEVSGKVNLSVENRWVLGRNEEFPGQRAFEGYIDHAKVFYAPLPAEDVLSTYKEELGAHR